MLHKFSPDIIQFVPTVREIKSNLLKVYSGDCNEVNSSAKMAILTLRISKTKRFRKVEQNKFLLVLIRGQSFCMVKIGPIFKEFETPIFGHFSPFLYADFILVPNIILVETSLFWGLTIAAKCFIM